MIVVPIQTAHKACHHIQQGAPGHLFTRELRTGQQCATFKICSATANSMPPSANSNHKASVLLEFYFVGILGGRCGLLVLGAAPDADVTCRVAVHSRRGQITLAVQTRRTSPAISVSTPAKIRTKPTFKHGSGAARRASRLCPNRVIALPKQKGHRMSVRRPRGRHACRHANDVTDVTGCQPDGLSMP